MRHTMKALGSVLVTLAFVVVLIGGSGRVYGYFNDLNECSGAAYALTHGDPGDTVHHGQAPEQVAYCVAR